MDLSYSYSLIEESDFYASEQDLMVHGLIAKLVLSLGYKTWSGVSFGPTQYTCYIANIMFDSSL